MLKIIKASEPIKVEHIVISLYGQPGIGKSTLGFSAEDPILLDFDTGAHRAAGRKDSVPITSWKDVTGITQEDLAPYKTVIVDTAGRALDFLTADIIKSEPKHGYGGALTLQGYGQLKSRFTAWLSLMRTFQKDVVLIAHLTEDKKGDDLIERIDVQGGSKGEIYKCADAMGKLYIENKKRWLNFNPTDTAFGKNPAALTAMEIPHIDKDGYFLAGVIETIKSKLNALTEDQVKRQEMIDGWLSKIEKAETVENFNKLATDSKDIDKSISTIVRSSIHKAATEAGFVADTKQKCYVVADNE